MIGSNWSVDTRRFFLKTVVINIISKAMSDEAMGVPVEKNVPQEVDMIDEDEMSDNAADCTGFDTSDDEQPFDTAPLTIDWLDLSLYGSSGQLCITDLPGCRFGKVWRKLTTDVDDLKKLDFTDIFVLCTMAELAYYRVPRLLSEYATAHFNIHHFPLEDENSPDVAEVLSILQDLREVLSCGRKILLHCKGGLGRSCFVVACLLLQLDPEMSSESAIERMRELRGQRAIETVKQYNFVNDFRKLVDDHQGNVQAVGEPRSISR